MGDGDFVHVVDHCRDGTLEQVAIIIIGVLWGLEPPL